MSAPAYTIGITTKDRAKSLATTVAHLAAIVPDGAELLVIDDGSASAVTAETWGKLPFPVRIIRHAQSHGLIVSRNELARACRTPFLLSCDDDSHPVTGDVGQAAAYLAGHPELIALSFPYREGPAQTPMNPSRQAEPYRVRQFIGCSHLMRLEYFLQLGGYWEWLVQQNEERELCYRALTRGWGVVHFPGVEFHHDYTPVGRDWNRHDFYTMRNEMAVEMNYVPPVAGAFKLARNFLLALVWGVKTGRTAHLRGYFAGLGARRTGQARRLTFPEFNQLRALTWS